MSPLFVVLTTTLGSLIFAYLCFTMWTEHRLLESQRLTPLEQEARDLVFLAAIQDDGAKVALKVIDGLAAEKPRSPAREARIVELSSAWEWPK